MTGVQTCALPILLDILQYPPEWITPHRKSDDERKRRLSLPGGGYAWRYMESRFFPELRASTLRVWYEEEDPPVSVRDTVYLFPCEESAEESVSYSPRPFYMSVSSNLLYDAVLLPNIGIEFYLGRGWSIAGNWMYTWLKSDSRHCYHRIYGGDLEVRRWLSYGKKPLTGHHVGLYG